jgi:hypothetical protein
MVFTEMSRQCAFSITCHWGIPLARTPTWSFPYHRSGLWPSGAAEIGRMQSVFSALATPGDERDRLQLFFREGIEAAAFVTRTSRHIVER